MPSLCFFHNSEPQNAGLVDVEKDLNLKKNQREFLCAKIKKISIIIKNVIEAEDTVMNSAERSSNYFFTEKQTTKFSSANFQKMLSPSYIILRI